MKTLFLLIFSLLINSDKSFENAQRNLASIENEIHPIEILPNQKTKQSWRDDFFLADEIWVIKKKYSFSEFLLSQGVAPFYIKDIEDKMVNYLPEDTGHLYSFYTSIDLKGEFVKISPEFKKKLPSNVLRAVYRYLKENTYKRPTISNENKESLIRGIRSWDLPLEVEKRFLNLIFNSGNKYHFLVTPDVWNYLPDELKDSYIDLYTDSKERIAKNGLKINVTFSTLFDIEELSRKYGMNPKHKEAISRLLKRKLLDNQLNPVKIPLESILTPFIRKHVNQFHLDGGPNCLNSALCNGRGKKYELAYVDDFEMRRVLSREYELLPNHDDLKMGDLIMYANVNGEIKHAATYIDENIVFTKNGINKFYPYAFQYQSIVEEFYSKKEKLNRFIYRQRENAQVKDHNCSELLSRFF